MVLHLQPTSLISVKRPLISLLGIVQFEQLLEYRSEHQRQAGNNTTAAKHEK
jgi:hypothetical protein